MMVETQRIEYKESWRDEYLKWVCGFANAQGGKIFIGCKDNGEVVGVTDSKRLMEEIPNKIRDGLGVIVSVNQLEQNGIPYIEIDVPAYPLAISFKGVFYIRSGATNQILTGKALDAFLMRRHGVTWDNLPLPSFEMSEVDDDAIKRFKAFALKKGRIEQSLLDESKETLLKRLHLTNGAYLTNAAMLLFCRDPERYQLGAYIKIGFFDNDADLTYQDEIRGPLLEQADKALEIIYLKYMKARIRYDGLQRVERYFVPEEALREALLNAICHKQYQSGVPIQISIYEDRLYVANSGRLPEGWTMDNLLHKHVSAPYNPSIAHTFYLASFIESWGRGVEKICRTLKAEDLPIPTYEINPGDIMIKFSAPEDWSKSSGGKATDKATDKVTDKVTDEVTDKVTEREAAILMMLSENPEYTTTQLAEKLSTSRKTVSARIKALKEQGILVRIGSDRKGRWEIRER